ncbi:MAG: hypothetical protein H0W83_16660 [Planctomycetes bacterium]|nr:hypothetical protein [Planctomycetota bacterium]
MSSIPLAMALCILQAVPSTIALVRAKDQGTKVLCGVLAALDLVVGVGPRLGLTLSGHLFEGACIALAVLGIVAAVRVVHGVLGTLIATSGILLALIALRIIG